jgi:undecaprenyl-diphosphatase
LNAGAPDFASLDVSILRAVYAGPRPTAWLTAALALSFLGSGWMLFGLLPWLATRTWRMPAVRAFVTLVTTSGAVSLIKLAAGRTRPCNAFGWCHTLPIEVPVDHSFPSGHAAGSFAFAVFAASLDRRAAWFLFPLAACISASRVVLGVHYPSDVVAGAILGSILGWLGARLPRASAAAR